MAYIIISAVRQLILMFVAFYALILDLFAAPQMLNFTPYWGAGESIGGGGAPGVPVILTLTVFLTTSIVLTLHRRYWEEGQRATCVSTSVHVKDMSTFVVCAIKHS